jgi:hypothetical protein
MWKLLRLFEIVTCKAWILNAGLGGDFAAAIE